MEIYSNFAHFCLENRYFLAKMCSLLAKGWCFIQDSVLIKSGVVFARVRYVVHQSLGENFVTFHLFDHN